MTTEIIDDDATNLHLLLQQPFLPKESSSEWFQTITRNAKWHRVKYKSHRFSKSCTTPCYTTFYGGRSEYKPYTPIPPWLQPLVDQITSHLNVPFNAILLRLYFDGQDEIAWHTDGRTFLGDTPTIASLSLGASATFQMRRMHNVWPPTDGSKSCEECIDKSVSIKKFVVKDGDLLVMRKDTQKHWHHCVPQEKGRKPRLNINFRYILEGPDAMRGQKTYYKYMVHGDEENPSSFLFKEIMSQRGGMMNFIKPVVEKESLKNASLNSCCTAQRKPSPQKSRVVLALWNEKTSKKESNEGKMKEKEEQNNKDDGDCAKNSGITVLSPRSSIPDCEVHAYLTSEHNIDPSIFLSLPLSIQQEQINLWKANTTHALPKKKMSVSTRVNKKMDRDAMSITNKKRKLQGKEEKQKKIHSFFEK